MEREVGLVEALRAERIKRHRQTRQKLQDRYDYYGDECGCACTRGQCGRGKFEGEPCDGCGSPLGLGQCEEHLRARPEQRPPGTYRSALDQADWANWLIEAGRGFGKTWTGAVAVNAQVQARRARQIALVNNTVSDVIHIQIKALEATAPPWCWPLYEPSKRTVTWLDQWKRPIGAVATVFSAETPELLRGPEFDLAWPDELAKWEHRQQETWDMLQFCMRIGDRPRIIITTTPRPTETYKQVRFNKRTAVTRGSTRDNASRLASTFIESIYDKYAGTRLGTQELDAMLLLDAPGALWNTDILERTRERDLVPRGEFPKPVPRGIELVRVAVSVDPSAGAQDPDAAAECGITVVGRASNGHGYVLQDRSLKGTPGQWGVEALRAYEDWRADVIVAERNNGGAMVEHVIRNAKVDGRPVGQAAPIRTVWATRGKMTRAEPVAMLFEQGRMHICGCMPALEGQLTAWVPDTDQPSPDRLDAMVWGGHEVMVEWFDQGHAVARGRRVEFSEMPAFGG